MRYNASHQRGYRCFIGDLADAPEQITEQTPRSFEGRTLFDALAEYRKTVESDGWRLLHAVARRDCWPKPDELFPVVQELVTGLEETQPVNGFDPAEFDKVGSLQEQQRAFEQWKQSLTPVHVGRVPPRAGYEHDPPSVDFGPRSRLAGRILSQKDD
jgi:hypothetical protein